MLTDAQVAVLYARIYEDPQPSGYWAQVFPIDGGYAAVRDEGGVPYLCFRGSTTLLDWFEDFNALAAPFPDVTLGPVHNGFRAGLIGVKDRIDKYLGASAPWVVGHSLGAGHAMLYAGYRRAAQMPLRGVVCFGEPRPGMAKLAGILQPVATRSYRNMDAQGHDLVTDVPIKIGDIIPYKHPKDLINVTASPAPDDSWGLLKYHHMSLYVQALSKGGL